MMARPSKLRRMADSLVLLRSCRSDSARTGSITSRSLAPDGWSRQRPI